MKEVTLIIKTFMRPWAISRLLESAIKEGYAGYPIIVIDDSRVKSPIPKKITSKLTNFRHIKVVFDIGLSAGRNRGLKECKTPYFMIFDDDMIITDRTDIPGMLAQIKKYDFDVLGGLCPGHERHSHGIYERGTTASGHHQLLLRFQKASKKHPDCMEAHYVLNFFIAKTESIRGMGGWAGELKIGREHVTFFVMAWDAGLRVAINRYWRVGHKGGPSSARYKRLRGRARKGVYNIQALNRMKCDIVRAVWPSGKLKFGWRRNKDVIWGEQNDN